MKKLDLFSLIGSNNYVILNKKMVKNIGLIESYLYSELISEYKYYLEKNQLDSEGMFYSTVENIKEQTGLKKDQQAIALRNLEKFGLIKVVKKGLPAKRYVKIIEDQEVICKALDLVIDDLND